MSAQMIFQRKFLPLLGILLLGFFLRFEAVHYGLPSKSLRLYTYHPDESGSFNLISQWGTNDFITSDVQVPLLADQLKTSASRRDPVGLKILEILGKKESEIDGLDKLAIIGALNALLRLPNLHEIASPDPAHLSKIGKSLLADVKNGKALSDKDRKRLNLALVMATYPQETQSVPKWKQYKFLYFHPGAASYWGGFHLYPMAACLKISEMVGYLKRGSRQFYMSNLKEADKIYLSCRFMMIGFSVLCIFLIYRIASGAYGHGTGLAAAFLSAILPVHIVYSVILKADSLMLALGLASIFFSFKLLKDGGMKNAVFAGIFLGITTATKFTAAPYALVVALACILSPGGNKIILLLASGFFALLAFFAGTPYFLIEFPDLFIDVFQWVRNAPAASIHKIMIGQAGWLNYATYYMPYAMGWPLTMACLASFFGLSGLLIHRLYKFGNPFSLENKIDIFFLASGAAIYLVTSATRQGEVHYTLTVLPFFLIFVSRGFMLLAAMGRPAAKIAAAALGFAILGYTGVYSAGVLRLYSQENIRETSSKWINNNIPKGSSIGMIQFACQMPTTLRAYDTPYKIMIASDEIADSQYKGSSVGLDPQVLRLESVAKDADYVVLTEHEYRLYLHPKLEHLFPEQSRILKNVMSEMEEVARFEKDPEFLGFTFPKGSPPADWMNPNGTIVILKNRRVQKGKSA